MKRRAFLSLGAMAALGFTLTPEGLWARTKLISIPNTRPERLVFSLQGFRPEILASFKDQLNILGTSCIDKTHHKLVFEPGVTKATNWCLSGFQQVEQTAYNTSKGPFAPQIGDMLQSTFTASELIVERIRQ